MQSQRLILFQTPLSRHIDCSGGLKKMFNKILPSAKPQKMAIKTMRNFIDEGGK